MGEIGKTEMKHVCDILVFVVNLQNSFFVITMITTWHERANEVMIPEYIIV